MQSNLSDAEVQQVSAYVWAISQTRGEPWTGGHPTHAKPEAAHGKMDDHGAAAKKEQPGAHSDGGHGAGGHPEAPAMGAPAPGCPIGSAPAVAQESGVRMLVLATQRR